MEKKPFVPKSERQMYKNLSQKTTSRDVPGSGMAKKAAQAIEARHKKLSEI